MNEFTDQNSCKYAEELVSYLYDEASRAEKSRFEEHLINCSSCADELADFSVVRSSIAEWRDREFSPLAVPAIQLPVSQVIFTPEISASRSLPAKIRALFSLSPAWAGAAAMAVLVICIGSIYVAVNFRNTPETARAGNDAKIETLSSQATNENNETQTAIAENEQKPAAEKSSEPPVIAVKEAKEKSEPIAVKISQPLTAKNRKAVATEKSAKPVKSVSKKINQSPPPALLADEDVYEDNSLRLSDIFKGEGGR